MSQPNTRSRRRIVFQVSVLALLLAIGFRVSVESSSRSPNSVLNDALVRGADRLLALQRPDGLWPSELSGSGDLSGSGRSGRALLSAWKTTRDARYLAAARHAADAIVPRMPRLERAPSLGNMMFLAELSEVTGDPQFADVARQTWAKRLTVAERADGAVAAKTLLSRRNSTAWLDGTWRNYLLSLKTFGLKAFIDALAWRYPRERLFNALPLLLWEPEPSAQPAVRLLLQKQLCTAATDWAGWVAAYKNIWPSYG